jgi:hypothetical protein
MRLHCTLVALLGLLLAGCGNDYQLSLFEPAPDDPEDDDPTDGPGPIRPATPALPPSPPTPPTPPNSPWPPVVGNVPDLYFAIAWSEWPCYWGNDVAMDGVSSPSEADVWMPCDARNVAVVNMFGEVVDEFSPEDLDDSVPVDFVQLANAGPGQFLHVFHRYDYAYDTDGDGFYGGSPWQAWRGDSYTGEHLMVATWDYSSAQAYLPQAGRYLDVGGYNTNLHLGVLPTDPNMLITWQGQQWCDPEAPIQPLQLTHMFDGSVISEGWQPEQFLPAEVRDFMDTPSGWNMDLSLNEDGDLSALFGVTTGGCSGLPEDPATLQLVSWSPSEGASWYAPTDVGWQPRAATYAGWRGSGALNLLGDYGEVRWRMTSPTAVSEGSLSPHLQSYRPGPVLDPQGPTFTVMGTDAQSWDGDSLDFYHQGEVVWSIDRLRFGLAERRVFFADVILLSQHPDEESD